MEYFTAKKNINISNYKLILLTYKITYFKVILELYFIQSFNLYTAALKHFILNHNYIKFHFIES